MARATAAARAATATARSTEDEERAEALQRAKARRRQLEQAGEHDLRSFIEYVSPKFMDPAHLEPLCEALDRSMREKVFILCEAPPRHAKTETILHAIARRLKHRPQDLCCYASYADDFANQQSRRARELAARAGVWVGAERRVGGIRNDPSAAVSFWQTNSGGGLVAGGRGGGYVGRGFQFMVVDDPFKNRGEAESPVIQKAVFEDLFQGTLFTRLEPGGSMLITHQPWNDNDLIANLREFLRERGVPVIDITLPAVNDATYDDDGVLTGGRPLWPERWPLHELQAKQAVLLDYEWESQFQCNRIARGARIFATDPVRYVKPNLHLTHLVISCDPGIHDDKHRDESGVVVASAYWEKGLDQEGKPTLLTCLDILLVREEHEEVPDTLAFLDLLQNKDYPGAPCLVEEVSAFAIISQVAPRLDNIALNITPVVPKGSKAIRAIPTARANAHRRIRVPQDAPWLQLFQRRLRAFTGKKGGKNGVVDALTQLFDYADGMLKGQVVGAKSGGDREMVSNAGGF